METITSLGNAIGEFLMHTMACQEWMFMGHIELGNKVPLPQGKDQLYAQWFAKQREGSFLIIVGSTSQVDNALC